MPVFTQEKVLSNIPSLSSPMVGEPSTIEPSTLLLYLILKSLLLSYFYLAALGFRVGKVFGFF